MVDIVKLVVVSLLSRLGKYIEGIKNNGDCGYYKRISKEKREDEVILCLSSC